MRLSLPPKWVSLRFPRLILLIGVEKTAACVVAAVGAAAALWIHAGHITDPMAVLLPELGTKSSRLVQAIDRAVSRFALHAAGLGLAAGLAFWAVLLGAEAIGVWLQRPWGELLIIVETASFLPFEVWGTLHQVRLGGLVALTVNALVLLYLAIRYARRRSLRRAVDIAAPDGGNL